MSGRQAARHFNISRESVRKILSHSEPPGYRRLKLDEFIAIIDAWLDGDREALGKKQHTAKQARLFSALQSHFMFHDRYGRPGKGNDKGSVEGLVGFARRNFMVPVPRFVTWADFNAYLEAQCRKRQEDILPEGTE